LDLTNSLIEESTDLPNGNKKRVMYECVTSCYNKIDQAAVRRFQKRINIPTPLKNIDLK